MKSEKNDILISVIIPTYGRPKQLTRCLESLVKQSLKEPWEIIVVDDGSDLDLTSIIDCINTSIPIRLYKQINSGPAKARNKGAELARGKYLVFTDDDCKPIPNWLENHFLNLNEGVMTGGQTINGIEKNIYCATSQVLLDFLYLFLKDTKLYFFTSNNLALSKTDFIEVGGFDESFTTSAGEDRAFCAKWLSSDKKMKYIGSAELNHYHDLNFKKLYRLHFKYGTAAVLLNAKMELMGIKNELPFMTFCLKLLSYAFKRKEYALWERVRLFFFLLVTQVANLHGRLCQKFKRKTKL